MICDPVAEDIGGGAADVADDAVEARQFFDPFDAAHHRLGRAGDKMAGLVRNKTAERASAGAAADGGDGELDAFIRGNRLFVTRMRSHAVGKLANVVELRLGERRIRAFKNKKAVVVTLNHAASAPGIHLRFDLARLFEKGVFIRADPFIGGEFHAACCVKFL